MTNVIFKDTELNLVQFTEVDLCYWRSQFGNSNYYITPGNLMFLNIAENQYLLMDLNNRFVKALVDKYSITYDATATPHLLRFANKNNADTFGNLSSPNNKIDNALTGVRYSGKQPITALEDVYIKRITWVRDASNVFEVTPTGNYVVPRGMDIKGAKLHHRSDAATTSATFRNYISGTAGKVAINLVNDPLNSGNTYSSNAQVGIIRLDNNSNQLQIMTNKTDTDVVIKGGTDASTDNDFQDRNIARFDSVDKSTNLSGELFVPARSHVELFLNSSSTVIPASSEIAIKWDQAPAAIGNAISVNLQTGIISLSKVGLYLVTAGFALASPQDVPLFISLVVFNAANTYSTPNYAYGNGKHGVRISHVLYISEAKTLEIRAGTSHTNNLSLITGASSGRQYTNASITFLG
jgi:hypothetical protein